MSGVWRMPDPEPYGSPREYSVICREIDGLLCLLPQTHIQSASAWKRTFPLSQSAFPCMDQFPYGNVHSLTLLNFQSKIRVNPLPVFFVLYLSLLFRRISCSYNVLFTNFAYTISFIVFTNFVYLVLFRLFTTLFFFYTFSRCLIAYFFHFSIVREIWI